MNQKTSILIDGRKLAQEILTQSKKQVRILKKKKIIPHLAVVLVGSNKASLSFIRQKQKAAKLINVNVTLHHFKKTPSYQELAEAILKISIDPSVHGVIVQQPLPPTLSSIATNRRISPIKDVDGFGAKTLYDSPIGIAMFKILGEIYYRHLLRAKKPETDFSKELIRWLKNQKIVLIGRGETGGKPIAEVLRKSRIRFIMAHSRTENISEFTKDADIIITCVGKKNVVKPNMLKDGCILIGIGINKIGSKLIGDYDEKVISEKAAFYTPTPGGVGPVNVACLIQNVVLATTRQAEKTS